ncbi:hypothetical protein P8605_50375, partial [Streptomyces sp. T-3]|nr:hypothetical protein [Streptomyces sp. T-3]
WMRAAAERGHREAAYRLARALELTDEESATDKAEISRRRTDTEARAAGRSIAFGADLLRSASHVIDIEYADAAAGAECDGGTSPDSAPPATEAPAGAEPLQLTAAEEA